MGSDRMDYPSNNPEQNRLWVSQTVTISRTNMHVTHIPFS